jgi:hypothetical protein
MITYSFGDQTEFEAALKHWKMSLLQGRLLRRLHLSPDEWALELAQLLHGNVSPVQFFEAWDNLHTLERDDYYPAYPRYFLNFWCKDGQSFRRACLKVWHDREHELSQLADDTDLDPMIIGILKLLSFSMYFAVGIPIIAAFHLPVDTLTLGFVVALFFFVYLIEAATQWIFGVSDAIVKRFLKRRAALQALKQRNNAQS